MWDFSMLLTLVILNILLIAEKWQSEQRQTFERSCRTKTKPQSEKCFVLAKHIGFSRQTQLQ